MIKPIVRDEGFLKQKSVPVKKEDLFIADDLEDTLRANRRRCVGMAANMIGYKKNMIIVSVGNFNIVMINPVITRKSFPYQTEEGCLSLDGERKTTRYEKITVKYQDRDFKSYTQEFSGPTAQIIQHECDHLKGIII